MTKSRQALLLAACTAVLGGGPTPAGADARPGAHGARHREHVSSLMPRLHPSLRGRVARAVVTEADRASLDPLLVVALIHCESSFDPDAVSSAGAVGLMQLKEETMRAEAARAALASSDPRDPVASVQAGVRYLRRLVDAFGELDLALMAYNAGPSRILAYARGGGIPQRFQAYPRRVRRELERLRAPPAGAGEGRVASAEGD